MLKAKQSKRFCAAMFLCLVILVIPVSVSGSQDENPVRVLFRTGGSIPDGAWRYGFLDGEGNIIVPRIFYYATPFAEGLAIVQRHYHYYGGRIDIINLYGEIESSFYPPYHARSCGRFYARPFSDGLALIGFGDFLAGSLYSEIRHCCCTEPHGTIFNIHGFQDAGAEYGFIDRNGNIIIPFGQFSRAKSFSDGLAAVSSGSGHFDLWGFIDKEGNEVIPQIYRSVHRFHDGAALVRSNYDGSLLWGLINMDGNEILPPSFSLARPFHEGFAAVAVRENDELFWGFINPSGEVVIPLIHEDVSNFSEGFAAVRYGGKWGFVDRYGTQILPFEYSGVAPISVITDVDGGIALVSVGEWDERYYGLVDMFGEVVMPFTGLSFRDAYIERHRINGTTSGWLARAGTHGAGITVAERNHPLYR